MLSDEALLGTLEGIVDITFLYDVDSDGGEGSQVYIDKQGVFVVFLVL